MEGKKIVIGTGLTPAEEDEIAEACLQLKADYIKHSVSSAFNEKANFVVVGKLLKSEKLCCSLLTGLPLVDKSFVLDSASRGAWLDDKIERYDLGNPDHPLRAAAPNIFVSRLPARRNFRPFADWRVVVLLGGKEEQALYENLLRLGGATVVPWSCADIVDKLEKEENLDEIRNLTLVLTSTDTLKAEDKSLCRLLVLKARVCYIYVLAHIFLTEYITRRRPPDPLLFDIRKQATREEKKIREDQKRMEDECELDYPTREVEQDDDELGMSQPICPDVSDDVYCDEDDVEDENSGQSWDSKDGQASESGEILLASTPVQGVKRTLESSIADNEIPAVKRPCLELSQESRVDLSQLDSSSIGSQEKKLRRKYVQPTMDLFVSKNGKPSPASSSSVCLTPAAKHLSSYKSRKPAKTGSCGKGGSREPQSSTSKDIVALTDDDTPSKSLCVSGPTDPKTHFLWPFLPKEDSLAGSDDEDEARDKTVGSRSSSAPSTDTNNTLSNENLSVYQKRLFYGKRMVTWRHNELRGLDVFPNATLAIRTYELTAKDGQESIDLSALQQMWATVDAEKNKDEQSETVDWINVCKIMSSLVTPVNYAPVQTVARFIQTMKTHNCDYVRVVASHTVNQMVQMYPPKAHNRKHYFDLLLGRVREAKEDIDPEEAFNNLLSAVESCILNREDKWQMDEKSLALESLIDDPNDELDVLSFWDSYNKVPKSSGCIARTNGSTLYLEYLLKVIYLDFDLWYGDAVKKDKIDLCKDKPLIATLLWPKGKIGFSKQFKHLVTAFVKSLDERVSGYDRSLIRRLVGLCAQMLHFALLASEVAVSNKEKFELAAFLADEINGVGLSNSTLDMELYLLQPSWLGPLVSTQMLARMTRKEPPTEPGLRYLLDNFVTNVSIVDASQQKQGQEKSVDRRQASVERLPLAAINSPGTSSTRKVTKRNKYGETVLHVACKKANLTKIRECLATPGVEVNAADNCGWTPLHEAVNGGSLAAVTLLLDYAPQTIDRFFMSSAGQGRLTDRADLLARDANNGLTPVHEAVVAERLDMVKAMLSKAKKLGGGVLAELFTVREKEGGATLLEASPNSEMTDLLNWFKNLNSNAKHLENEHRGQAGENCSVSLLVSKPERFSILINRAVQDYIRALELIPQTIFTIHGKITSTDSNGNLPDPLKRWRAIKLGVYKDFQFGRAVSFGLQRSHSTSIRDARDVEKLFYNDKPKCRLVPVNHPLSLYTQLIRLRKQDA